MGNVGQESEDGGQGAEQESDSGTDIDGEGEQDADTGLLAAVNELVQTMKEGNEEHGASVTTFEDVADGQPFGESIGEETSRRRTARRGFIKGSAWKG